MSSELPRKVGFDGIRPYQGSAPSAGAGECYGGIACMPRRVRKDDDERKGGALPWWGGSGRGGSAVLSAGRSAPSPGWLGKSWGLDILARGSVVGTKTGWVSLVTAKPWLPGALILLAGTGLFMMGSQRSREQADGNPMYVFKGDLHDALTSVPEPIERSLMLAPSDDGFALYPGKESGESEPEPADEEPAAADGEEAVQGLPEFPLEEALAQAAPLQRSGFLKQPNGSSFVPGGAMPDPALGIPDKRKSADVPGTTRGKSESLLRTRKKTAARGIRTRVGRTRRAMGQLKLANDMSLGATQSPYESQARSYATDAFEQSQTVGAAGENIEGSGLDSIPATGLSPGAPDVTEDSNYKPQNATPYQDDLDKAKKQAEDGKLMMILGAALIAMGAILALIGMMLMKTACCAAIGKVLLLAGLAMAAGGAALLALGQKKRSDAKEKAKKIKEKSGQKDQGRIAEDYADDPDAPIAPIEQPSNTVQQDAAAESGASYSLQ